MNSLLKAIAYALAVVASGASLSAQFNFDVVETSNSQNIRWVVRDNSDVLGIDNAGDTFVWDPVNLVWNATGATTISFFGSAVFVTRGVTAAHWDGVQINQWNGSDWVASSVSGSPPPSTAGNQCATGLPTGEIVIFSGVDVGTFPFTWLTSTWVLSTADVWSVSTPSPSPTPRTAGMMTSDSAGTVVLFGGSDSSGTLLSDTWEFSGGAWTAQSPATSPAARVWAAFTFRPSTNNALLFGGNNGSSIVDAWNYTVGGTWTAVSASYSGGGTLTNFNSALHVPTDEVIAGEVAGVRTFMGTLNGDNTVWSGCNCAGSGGTFGINSIGPYQPATPPPANSNFTLTFRNYQVGTALWFAFDAAPAATPVPLSGFPSGCNLNLAGISGSILVDANPPASPAPTYAVSFPNSPSVIGARVVYQGYQIFVCVTEALDVRIGR